MEEGTKSKKTVFVGGISEDTDETTLYEGFSTFGDIIEVQLPPPALTHYQQTNPTEPKHRGFAFITFGSSADAQDAIDNMDMNELKGRVLKVNLARPMKGTLQPNGNRAIWESEEWLKEHVKPLAQSGGVQGRLAEVEGEDGGENKSDNDAMEE
ncbi:RNA-binding domain-containing protein [Phlegmacium glaucopus]|nr:RNA-binding domain-containing protein [Phlegmacium glaucopus]